MTAAVIRTVLFVPGDRGDRIPKAATAGADAVAIDLEDAVARGRKHVARATAAEALAALPDTSVLLWVRVNGVTSGLLADDMSVLIPVLARLDAIVLPMVDSPRHVEALAALLDEAEQSAGDVAGRVGIVPLIETAAGVLSAAAIAASSARVRTLTLGPADLSQQIGVTLTPQGSELLAVRSQLVLAAAAAGLPAPIDGPWLGLDDEEGLRTATRAAKALGFAGKQVLHPKQLDVVRAVFAPTIEEMDWAHRVDDAFTAAEAQGVSSIRLDDGTFVDYPVALRARAILEDGA